MANDKLKLDSFSKVEKDEIFNEAFMETFFPELIADASFDKMRDALDKLGDDLWEKGDSKSPKAPLQQATKKLFSTIHKAKSSPASMTGADRAAIIEGYQKVCDTFQKMMASNIAATTAAISATKTETARISASLDAAKRSADEVEKAMPMLGRSQHDLQMAQRRAEQEIERKTRELAERQRRLAHLMPLPNSSPMNKKMTPQVKGINFALPWISPVSDRTFRAGKIKASNGNSAVSLPKGKFATPKTVKTSTALVQPFQTNAADHARGIGYSFQGANREAFAKMFGEDFISASGTGAVPRNKRVFSGSSSAAAYGTAMHALFEMMDKKGLSIMDLTKQSKSLSKQPLLNPAFVGGALKPQALAALQARRALLDSGDEETIFNEQGVGAFVRVNGELQKRTATIDRLARNKRTGEVFLEDYKNEKDLHPFEHFMQLQAEAVLLNANNGLIKDNKGRLINLGAPVTKARVAKYDPETGRQSFYHYDLGSTEDFIKYLALQEQLNASPKAGEKPFTEEDFLKQLPEVFKKPYSDSFGLVRRNSSADGQGKGLNWLEIKLPTGEYSTLSFDKNGMPRAKNKLFDLWKSNPEQAISLLQKVFNSSMTPDEYKKDLYWKLHQLRTIMFGAGVKNTNDIHRFAEDLIQELPYGVLHPDDAFGDVNQKIRGERLTAKQQARDNQNLEKLLSELTGINRELGISDPELNSLEWYKKNVPGYSDALTRHGALRSSLLTANASAFESDKSVALAPMRKKLQEATRNRIEAIKKRVQAAKNSEGLDPNSPKGKEAARELAALKREEINFEQIEYAQEQAIRYYEEQGFAEEWLRKNYPEYLESGDELARLEKEGRAARDKQMKFRSKAGDETDDDYRDARKNWERRMERRSELMDLISKASVFAVGDWFEPATSTVRTRAALAELGLLEYEPENASDVLTWQKTSGVRNALYTATHYHPEYMGEKVKGLLEVLKERDTALSGSPEARSAYRAKYQQAIASILGEMTPEDIQQLKTVFGSEDVISAAQSTYEAMKYNAEAEGKYTDTEEFASQVENAFSANQTENIAGRYLRVIDKLRHGYIGDGISDADRVQAVKAINSFFLPGDKDAIDLVGTLTGGMARYLYGSDIYDSMGHLTPEQQKEQAFGHRIRSAIEQAAALPEDEQPTFAEFFRTFGEQLLEEFKDPSDIYGYGIDADAIRSTYGDAVYGWTQRLSTLFKKPWNEDEIEQRGAEMFRRSERTGKPIALGRWDYPNKGPGIGHLGLTARYLMEKGIPLSALHYERGYHYEDATLDDLAKYIGLTEEELANQTGIAREEFGEWRLYDPEYREIFEKALQEFDHPISETLPKKDKSASRKTKPRKAGAKASASSIDIGGAGSGTSAGTAEIGSSDGGGTAGGPVTINGSPVNVTGNNIKVTGSPVNINEIPNGIVYNQGDGPLTQNIYTTGSVVLQGGGAGGSGGTGTIGRAEWSDLPLAQQYQYLKNREFSLEGDIAKEKNTIANLSLYGTAHTGEIAKREENVKALDAELVEVRDKIKEVIDASGDLAASFKDAIDERIADRRAERDAEARVAEGKLADKKASIAAGQHHEDYKKLESLYSEQSAILKKMVGDQYRSDKSSSGLEKKAIDDLNAGRAKEIELIQGKIAALKASSTLTKEDIASIEKAAAATDELNMLEIKAKNKGITNLWESLGTSFHNMIQRFTQMGLAYSLLNKLKKSISEIVQAATQLDKAMVNLRVVTGASYEEAKTMIHGYAQLGSELAATTLEVSTAAQEWLRQGYNVAEVNRLVESSIKLSVLGMMSASDATKALTSAMKGFKMEAGDVSKIVDKFTSLDMKAATTAGDIATALSKFATTAQMAGVDIDQAAAMATTIMDVSQNDAGATGNALKTIFSRFGNVKAGTFQKMSAGDSDETTDKINDIERVLNTLGIQVRSSAREMRDFDDVLNDIAERWQFLDKVSQNAIATALAGTRQRESFAVLMNNYDKYKDFLEVSQNSSGTADKKYQSYLEQLEASQKRLKAAWEDIANSAEISRFMTFVNNTLANAVKLLPTIIRYATKLFVTLNSYKMPKMLSSFLTLGESGSMIKGRIGSARSAKGLRGKIAELFPGWTSEGIQKKADAYYADESGLPFISRLSGSFSGLTTKIESLSGAIDTLILKTKDEASASGSLASAKAEEKGSTEESILATRDEIDASSAVTAADLTKADAAWGAAAADAAKSGMPAGIPTGGSYHTLRHGSAKGRHINPKAAMAATSAITSIAGGLTMGNQGMNWSNMAGGLQAASDEANVAATTNSTIASAFYLWNPIAGMIATLLADLLNKFFLIPLIDADKNARKARVEYANKLNEQISGLADNIQALRGYAAKSSLAFEEMAEMTESVYRLLDEYYAADNGARENVEHYLLNFLQGQELDTDKNITTMYDAMKVYAEGSEHDRKIIALALQYAQQQASLQTKTQAQEEIQHQRRQDAVNALTPGAFSTGNMHGDVQIKSEYEDLVKMFLAEGIVSPNSFRMVNGRYMSTLGDIDALRKSLGEYSAQDLKDMIDQLIDHMDKSDEEKYVVYRSIQKKIDDLAAAEEAANDAYNRQAAVNALLVTQVTGTKANGETATELLYDKTIDELKFLGTDAIMKLVAETLEKTGAFSGESIYVDDDSKNGLTDYAQRIIKEVLMGDPTFASIISGSIYSLSDLRKTNGKYNWENRQDEYSQLVKSFSAALHLSQEDLIEAIENGDLVAKLGNMTLNDFLKTPEELRQSMEDLSSIFKSLSSDAFLTAENLEKIIDKYPNFIQYLGETSSLMDAVISSLSEYAQVYATKIYDQLLSSTGYADSIKDNLRESGEYDLDKLRALFGDASNLKEMVEVLEQGPSALGLDEETFKKLAEYFQGLFKNIDIGQIFMREVATDMIMPYLDMELDRQLENLNKQKEALQQINKQREYENKLIEARNQLEEAGKEKKRVWREGVGWVYEADQSALAEAQKNLEEVENERQVREIEIMIEQINAEKELVKAIQDDAKYTQMQKAMESLLGEPAGNFGINGLINITKKMYDGDADIAGSIPGIGRTLSELQDVLSVLLKEEFGVNYDSNDSLDTLMAKAKTGTAEEQSAAAAELSRRGYRDDGSGKYIYELPKAGTSVTSSMIKEAQRAYGVAQNSEEIGEWLQNQGYEYNADSKVWTKKRSRIHLEPGGDYVVSGHSLSKESERYQWIDSDFQTGKAAYFHYDGIDENGNKKYSYVGDIDPNDYGNDLATWASEHNGDIILGWYGNQEYALAKGGALYNVTPYKGNSYARGSLGVPGGPSLLNEAGTEAIVTPYGTVTSLPSGTGVVPADITKNLWALGEVAPGLSRLLDPMIKKDGDSVFGDNFNVQNMVVNMNPDGSFDVDKFINELKSAVALRKNS